VGFVAIVESHRGIDPPNHGPDKPDKREIPHSHLRLP
jgi:hypothetical protein